MPNLVKGKSKATINVHAMEHSQTQHSTHEVEVREMFLRGRGGEEVERGVGATHGVDGGVRIDLQSVHIISRVLEQSVVWIEHVVAEEVEPLASYASIVQSIFSFELYQQFLLELRHSHVEYLPADGIP